MTARGTRHRLAYCVESAYGTTPASPAMKELRHVSTSLGLERESYQSGEMRSDRMPGDLRLGPHTVLGDIGIELAPAAFDDMLESLMFSSWTGNTLKVGTARKSFTIERGFLDIGQFHRFQGCLVNQLSVSVPASGIATGTFGLFGKSMGATATSQLGVPAAAPAHGVLDAASGSISEGGSVVAFVTAVEFTVNNNLQHVFAIGSNFAADTLEGRCNVEGTLTALFKDASMFNKFRNETASSLSVTMTGGGHGLTFTFPHIKYTTGGLPMDGEGPILLNMGFTALRDAGAASNLVIARTLP